MFRKLISVILLLIFTSCATLVNEVRNPDRLLEIRHQNVEFQPEEISLEINPDFYLNVTPVDASEIDSITSIAVMRSGAYESSLIENFYDDTNQALTQRQLKMVDAINLIFKKIENGDIPNDVGISLVNRISRGESTGYYGIESEVYSKNNYEPIYNPYYYNNNYLSV